ncbi:MAG: class I SAM-dependent methyltransferase [Methanomassiliicoccaceae archaeon]|nr:class I SAM-dependent methyltransferase [Methanomassiliicoccaceae archaeon]
MAALHPLDSEDVPESEKIRFWDIFAETYSSAQQGDMPDRIVEWLSEEGFLNRNFDVLEIGSGPGTYSLIMSRFSKTVSCLDSSGKMMDRLFASADAEGINNLERIQADWNSFASERSWDTVLSALCSGSGTPDSIDRMDSFATRHCVMISWIENHGDDLQSEIWSKLGREYSYRSRTTNDIVKTLERTGRLPETHTFSAEISIDMSVEEAVRSQTKTFSVFGLEEEAVAVTREILEKRSVDGIYRFRAVNRLLVTVWEPLK